MKYIIQSESFFIKKEEVEKIIKFINIKKEQIFIFDYAENQFLESLNQYLSTSIFGEKKLVILNNCLFLEKKILDKNLIKKLEIIINTNIENYLIFKNNNFSKNNKLLNEAIKSKKIELITKEKPSRFEITNFLKNEIKKNNFFLDSYTIKKILRYTKYDYDILKNELEKFFLSKKELNQKNIDQIIYDYVGENIFQLYDALLEKNTFNLNNILNSLRIKNISPIFIIEYLIKELQYLLLIKNYNNLNLKEKTSFLELKLNSYRLKKMYDNANIYNYEYIENIIIKLIKALILFKSNSSSSTYQLFISKIVLISSQL
ncbi:/ / DNA polymerase III subunit delta / 334888:335838 Reverse [Candidatus Hepatoplasma crinochetorum]|uniref:DNA-directed DNA polymerase n=1 Tax=Candidatus Hepatoplasma crinochetorum TaxID=295596 RepID=A0A0G7ZL21_9MOLU|nr:/ / DNA polymerase III subunit delta / 334888:335838 Reverse [Candidatus Hepatoplasma crinochetorum]